MIIRKRKHLSYLPPVFVWWFNVDTPPDAIGVGGVLCTIVARGVFRWIVSQSRWCPSEVLRRRRWRRLEKPACTVRGGDGLWWVVDERRWGPVWVCVWRGVGDGACRRWCSAMNAGGDVPMFRCPVAYWAHPADERPSARAERARHHRGGDKGWSRTARNWYGGNGTVVGRAYRRVIGNSRAPAISLNLQQVPLRASVRARVLHPIPGAFSRRRRWGGGGGGTTHTHHF